jgi:uncharacterized membrane protein
MRNYVAVVFDDTSKAYEGLHALWQLDAAAEVTVHGTAVVHRDALGNFQVDTKETHPALATAVGVGVGALLGLLAGPAGAAVGATGGAAIGAATGGMVGVDLGRADTRDQAAGETAFVLRFLGIFKLELQWIGDAVRCHVGRLGSRIPNHTTLTIPNVGQVDLEGAVASATLDHTPGNASVYPFES